MGAVDGVPLTDSRHDSKCVFCSPYIEPWVLWEGIHYRIVADAFPRLPGHVLLITREHVLHHADAPTEWWPELEMATGMVCEFLKSVGNAATFWENGYIGKEVPHAHLHGMPVQFPDTAGWVISGTLMPVKDWDDVRRAESNQDGYTLLVGDYGRYLALDRTLMLGELRKVTLARTGQTLDPVTGGLRRGGIDEVVETRRLWTGWTMGPEH